MKTLGHWTRGMLMIVATIVIAAPNASALEKFQFTETSTYQLGDEPSIDLESVSGEVTYLGSNTSETKLEMLIEVRAESEEEARQIREEIEIRIESHTDILEAWVDYPKNFSKTLRRHYGKDRSISVSFYVTGPRGARGSLSSVSGFVKAELMAGPLDISSVSGDVLVNDIQKRVRANSVSGQMAVEDCHDYVHAETVSGDLQVRNCGRDLVAKSVSGSVVVANVLGAAEVSSVSGDIDARAVEKDLNANTTSGQIEVDHREGNLELHSVSGDIVARTESSHGDLRINSHSGSVRLYANVTDIGDIEISTFSGDMKIDSDLGGKSGIGRGTRARGSLSFTLGDGGLHVDMSTFSGDIYIGEL